MHRLKLLPLAGLLLAAAMIWPAGLAAKPPPKIIVEVGAGHAFSIELPSRQDQGYSWSLARPLNDNMLEITGARYQRSRDPQKPGTEIWSFRSLAPGLAEIHFQYKSSFGGQQEIKRTRVYQIMMWDRNPDRRLAPGHGPSGEPDQ